MTHSILKWIFIMIFTLLVTTLPIIITTNDNYTYAIDQNITNDSLLVDASKKLINISIRNNDEWTTTNYEWKINSTQLDSFNDVNDAVDENIIPDIDNQLIDLMLPRSLRTVATVVCIIVLILGVGGNILVPLVVCRTRELCTNSTNVFLINLSIADLLVLVVCMPTVLIELHSKPEVWMLGKFMCKTVPFVELVVAHGSILTILAISFERYYAICKPLKANYKCTNRRAVITICCLWSFALIATVPVLFGTELVQEIYIDGSVVDVCLTKANATWQRLYFFVSIIGFFCLPLIILIVVYCIITRRLTSDDRRLLIASIHSSLSPAGIGLSSNNSKIRSGSLPFASESIISSSDHHNQLSSKDATATAQSLWHPAILLFRGSAASAGSRCGSSSGASQNQQHQPRRNSSMAQAASVARSRRQVIFMLAAVVICFFLCLLPFRLFTFWLLVVSEDEIQALSMERFYNLLYFCRVMIYVNSMLNPLLYALVSSKFRSALVDTIMSIFSCFCCYFRYCCCMIETDSDPLSNEYKSSHKNHRRAGGGILSNRRRRFILMRQSTTLTTATTTTTASSSSLKNNSIRSITRQCLPQSSGYWSSDSIRCSKSTNNQQQQSNNKSIVTQLQQNSFDSNQTSMNSNSAAESSSSSPSSVAAVADSSPNSPPKLNAIYSSQHTAEYRRKAMMRRSSRVAIIDEDCDEDLQSKSLDHHTDACQIHSIEDDNDDHFIDNPNNCQADNDDVDDQQQSASSSLLNIEELLNDEKFVQNESYV